MKIQLTVQGYIINENKLLLIRHKKTRLWLPPGGHLEENETPTDGALREVKEETGLIVKLLNTPTIPQEGNVIKQLAVPFYSDIHRVNDHIHCGLNYLCEPLTNKISLDEKEVDDFDWFSKESLYEERTPVNIRNIGLLAFSKYREFIK